MLALTYPVRINAILFRFGFIQFRVKEGKPALYFVLKIIEKIIDTGLPTDSEGDGWISFDPPINSK